MLGALSALLPYCTALLILLPARQYLYTESPSLVAFVVVVKNLSWSLWVFQYCKTIISNMEQIKSRLLRQVFFVCLFYLMYV